MIERYSRPLMSALWSEEAKFRTWLDIEVLVCEGWAKLGQIPALDLKQIQEKARFELSHILEKEKNPLDVDSIAKNLIKNNLSVDKVTIFRIMNSLTQKGIVNPIQFNEGKLRYEYAARPDHHHFVCTKCGFVEDIALCNVDEIIKNISKKKGFLVKRHSLEFFGLCANCQS